MSVTEGSKRILHSGRERESRARIEAELAKAEQKEAAPTMLTASEREKMIAVAAYYRAEARGFVGGSPEDDWYQAEAELRERLARGVEQTSQSGESSA
ncbi:MAG TPA: DUF2934 domain-containing protein [Burkholderiales bacterium]|nr:DUF2934 domain-containing protein [Burkholderiales bacterium]